MLQKWKLDFIYFPTIKETSSKEEKNSSNALLEMFYDELAFYLYRVK